MADEKPRRSGGLRAVVLWLLIATLLAAVWWLASDRNERHFHLAASGNQLVIERGRFFPTGTSAVPENDKLYAPVPIPQGEKPPAEAEYDDQNALDRFLFDLLSGWAKSAAKRNDTHTAAGLVDRVAQLPGLTGAQMAVLASLRADLAWDDAHADLTAAAQAIESARRKLELVKQNNGAHAPEAAALQARLSGLAAEREKK